MKPLSILLLTVACTVMQFSCNEPNDDPIVRRPAVDNSTTTLSGKYVLLKKVDSNGVLIQHIEFDVRMNGEGEMNKFRPSTLNLNHQEVIRLTEDRVFVSHGSFNIWDIEGNELYGQYMGESYDDNGDVTLHGTINGGNGEFKNAIGTLDIKVISQGNLEYIAWVTGKVQIRKAEMPTVL